MAEIVTREMMGAALAAYDHNIEATGRQATFARAMKAALLAVAPLIRRAALEEAAGLFDLHANEARRDEQRLPDGEKHHAIRSRLRSEANAAAIRALATKEPGQ